VATDGIADKAVSPDELTAIYLRSLEMVAPTATVPVSDSSFLIDPSVEEFTLLAFFDGDAVEVGLFDPAGQPVTQQTEQVQWYNSEQFVLVTVTAPQAGSWRLQAPQAARTRVTVISDLQLDVDPMHNNMPVGKAAELGLQLRDGGVVVTDPELMSLFRFTVQLSGPDNFEQTIDVSSNYDLPATGEYRVKIPGFSKPGRYEVTARLTGETLERDIRMYVDVTPPPSTATVTTRGNDLPPDDFRTPATAFAAIAVAIALLVLVVLRRRKRRRIEVWERRQRDDQQELETEAEVLVSGVSAQLGERGGKP
jgi:hypothetical protein